MNHLTDRKDYQLLHLNILIMTVLEILIEKFLYENVQIKYAQGHYQDIISTGIVTSIEMGGDVDCYGIYMFLQNETRSFKLSDNDFNITIV